MNLKGKYHPHRWCQQQARPAIISQITHPTSNCQMLFPMVRQRQPARNHCKHKMIQNPYQQCPNRNHKLPQTMDTWRMSQGATNREPIICSAHCHTETKLGEATKHIQTKNDILLVVAFEDPDGKLTQDIFSSKFLYAFGNNTPVKVWKEQHKTHTTNTPCHEGEQPNSPQDQEDLSRPKVEIGQVKWKDTEDATTQSKTQCTITNTNKPSTYHTPNFSPSTLIMWASCNSQESLTRSNTFDDWHCTTSAIWAEGACFLEEDSHT